MSETLNAQGTKLRILAALAISGAATLAGGVVTVTAAAHGLDIGDRIQTATGTFTVLSAPTAGSFTYADADGADGPLSYTPFLTIAANDFNGPGGQASIVDATTLLSTSKEKRMGLKDEGQITFNVFFNPGDAAQIELRAARAAQGVSELEIEFSEGTIWAFSGLVLSFAVSGAIDGLVQAAVAVEITGEVTQYD